MKKQKHVTHVVLFGLLLLQSSEGICAMRRVSNRLSPKMSTSWFNTLFNKPKSPPLTFEDHLRNFVKDSEPEIDFSKMSRRELEEYKLKTSIAIHKNYQKRLKEMLEAHELALKAGLPGFPIVKIWERDQARDNELHEIQVANMKRHIEEDKQQEMVDLAKTRAFHRQQAETISNVAKDY